MRNLILTISRMLDATARYESIANDINSLLKTWVGPIFIAIGGIGLIYSVVLGVQYAKSENDNKRGEIKSRLINCVIGIIVIIILVTLCMTIDWGAFVQIFGYANPEYSAIIR